MSRKKGREFLKGLAVLIVLTIALLTVYHIFIRPQAEVGRERPGRGKKEGASADKLSPSKAAGSGIASKGKASDGAGTEIAIIIDDIGYNLTAVKELLDIDAPLAFAVLPHTPHSVAAAEMIHRAQREILLHLPMEARNSVNNPGPGALFRWMEEAEIRRLLEEDLSAVPYVVGVNNHMGSAFMEDEERLNIVLQDLKERGLFFIDSRTTTGSRAEGLAMKTGIRFASRKLFLDNEQDQGMIFKTLIAYLGKDSNAGAVIIGHPYPATIGALKEAVPLLKSRGIRIVSPSEIVKLL